MLHHATNKNEERIISKIDWIGLLLSSTAIFSFTLILVKVIHGDGKVILLCLVMQLALFLLFYLF